MQISNSAPAAKIYILNLCIIGSATIIHTFSVLLTFRQYSLSPNYVHSAYVIICCIQSRQYFAKFRLFPSKNDLLYINHISDNTIFLIVCLLRQSEHRLNLQYSKTSRTFAISSIHVNTYKKNRPLKNYYLKGRNHIPCFFRLYYTSP